MATDGAVNRHNSVAYTAQQERRLATSRLMPGPASEPFSGRSGRPVNGAGLAVSVDSTGAGTYTVTAGAGVIYDSAYATQGAWEFEIDTSIGPVSFPARPAGGTSRVDLIIARIYDQDISVGAVREVKIERVNGTASASPSAPSMPFLSLLLATVLVPSSGTISVTANPVVTTAAGGILPVATTAERNALVTAGIAYRGLVIDNAQTGSLERFNGTAWTQLQEVDYAAPVTVSTYGSGFAATAEGSAYSRKSGWVEVTLVAAKTTIAATDIVFTLPVGFRPDRKVRFIGQFSGAIRCLEVNTDGTVVVAVATTGGVAASVSFPAA